MGGDARRAARRPRPRGAGGRAARARAGRPERSTPRAAPSPPAPARHARAPAEGVRQPGSLAGQLSWRTPLAQHGVDDVVEHRGLVAQHRQRRQHVVLGGRVQREQSRGARPRAERRVRRCPPATSAPCASQYAAVSARVMPSSGRTIRPERSGMPSSARRPGELIKPVEDGLGLVGGGVADGDQRVALRGEPLRLRVAHRPRPGLDVALRRPRAVDDAARRRAARRPRGSAPRRRRTPRRAGRS